jgi:hypothetical protein
MMLRMLSAESISLLGHCCSPYLQLSKSQVTLTDASKKQAGVVQTLREPRGVDAYR